MSFIVLTAEFAHETNTFSSRQADHAAFLAHEMHLGEDARRARRGTNTPLGGFLDVADTHGWQTIHAISAAAAPSGYVTRDAFERIAGCIVACAQASKSQINGVLLGLHGAMVPEFCDDGEGELLKRLRAVLGRSIPIAITLDPHANVTPEMVALADIIVSYKTYPHVDMRLCGHHAAGLLQRTMLGEIKPRTISAHRPMLEEVNGGRTDIGPMIDRIARARAYEAEPHVLAVSVNGGFGNADITEIGPTVLVTADISVSTDLTAHHAFAQSLMDDVWERRFERLNNYLSVDEAAQRAVAFDAAKGPLIIADYADNPGGGAYGDGTNLLAALLRAGVQQACLGPMVDPELAASLQHSTVGARMLVSLGGKTDARVGGPPLELVAELVSLSDGDYVGDGPMIGGLKRSWGPTAVLRVDGVTILVVTQPCQIYDQQQFRAFGIDPSAMRVIALKSMQHFRAAFEGIAGDIVVCDSGALCTPDLAKLSYQNVPRPIFPLDTDFNPT